jgi:hypothetical protein
MKRSSAIRPSLSKWLGLLAILYTAYLFKTAMGVNISNRYSASWLLKVPLEPLWSSKTELCLEFRTLCTARSTFQHKIQDRVDLLKRSG